jgi:Spy/CpxP family protein refolding chaperone
MHVAVAAIAAVLALAPVALAQPGPGGDRDRDWKPVWTLQAQGVAADLKLDDAQTQKLTDAYVAGRTSYQDAANQGRDGDRRTRFEAMLKVANAERAKLRTALAEFLSAEQVDQVMKPLGSFNRQYDRLTAVLADFKLDAEKQQQALVLINAYAADAGSLRENTSSTPDWQGMRAKMEASKATLDAAMVDVLSESQLATWKEETAWRGRGERPRDGAGPGGVARQSRGGANSTNENTGQ